MYRCIDAFVCIDVNVACVHIFDHVYVHLDIYIYSICMCICICICLCICMYRCVCVHVWIGDFLRYMLLDGIGTSCSRVSRWRPVHGFGIAFYFDRTIAVRWLEPEGFAIDPLAGVVPGYLHGDTVVHCGIVPIRTPHAWLTLSVTRRRASLNFPFCNLHVLN